jgi:ribonuclease HII
MMPKRQLRGHDLRAMRDCHGLIGVDEAGRGALAGPVVAGAVLVNRSFLESDWCRRHAPAINDSKQLSALERAQVYERMEWLRAEHRILFAAGQASVGEIESENILGATKLAMRRAIEGALALGGIRPHPPDPLFEAGGGVPRSAGDCITDWTVLVDGRPLRGLGFIHRAIVAGDAKSLVIAMASIVAKVTRDRMMEALEISVPGYGFGRHKGYATGAHRDSLLALGASPHHRSLFIRTFLERGEDPGQAQFDFAGESEIFPASDAGPVEEILS